MPWIIGGATVVAGALGLAGAKEAAEATGEAGDVQKYIYEQQREEFKPYRELGTTAIPGLQYLATGTGTPFDITASPLYQWQKEQGIEDINKALAARGKFGSGAGIEAISDFTRALGAEETERQFGRLLNLTAVGQGAAGATAEAAGRYGTAASNLALTRGQQAADLYGGLGNLALSGTGAYLQQRGYQDYLNKFGGTQ